MTYPEEVRELARRGECALLGALSGVSDRGAGNGQCLFTASVKCAAQFWVLCQCQRGTDINPQGHSSVDAWGRAKALISLSLPANQTFLGRAWCQ